MSQTHSLGEALAMTNEGKAEKGEPRVYLNLAALVKAEAAALNEGAERAYAVTTPEKSTVYVVTNSPANAALAVATVDRVSQKTLLAEALKAAKGVASA